MSKEGVITYNIGNSSYQRIEVSGLQFSSVESVYDTQNIVSNIHSYKQRFCGTSIFCYWIHLKRDLD